MIFQNRQHFIDVLNFRRQSGAADGIGLTAAGEREMWADVYDTLISYLSTFGVTQLKVQDFTTIDTAASGSTLVSQTTLQQAAIGDVMVEIPTTSGSVFEHIQTAPGGSGFYLMSAAGVPIYDPSLWVPGCKLGRINSDYDFEVGSVLRLWYGVSAALPTPKGYPGELVVKIDISLTQGQTATVTHNFGAGSVITEARFVVTGSRKADTVPVVAASINNTTLQIQPTATAIGKLIISGYLL